MTRFSTGYETGDGFRSPLGGVKDGNAAIAQEKDSLLDYQAQLDALAESIGSTKYVLLLAQRLEKGDRVASRGDRVVVKGDYSEIETSQEFIEMATLLRPLLAGLAWPKR